MKLFFAGWPGQSKMVKRVKSITTSVVVNNTVEIPEDIYLNPEEEWVTWWIKYDCLYYNDKDGKEQKHYFVSNYDGDYKRPDFEEVELEDVPEGDVPEGDKKCIHCNGRDCEEDCLKLECVRCKDDGCHYGVEDKEYYCDVCWAYKQDEDAEKKKKFGLTTEPPPEPEGFKPQMGMYITTNDAVSRGLKLKDVYIQWNGSGEPITLTEKEGERPSGVDGGLMRKLRVCEIPYTFPEMEKAIEDALEQEAEYQEELLMGK